MRPASVGYAAREVLRACISREFRLLASHASSPIVDWLRALDQALHPEFRENLRGMENPYGNGAAAETIARVLTTVPLDGLLIKQPTPLLEETENADER